MPVKDAKPVVDRRQLQQIITGLNEGVVLVDPSGPVVWANDAVLAMHGCHQLTELGTTAVAYRKRFALREPDGPALAARRYPLARLLAGDKFSGVEVEVRRRDDEEFHRVLEFRSLVLTDRGGNAESLVLVVDDVTERVSAEERFERAFAANPAPAVILRLEDSRYIKVNEGFMEMTGFTSREIVGRPMRELDVLRDAEHRDEAIHALREHETIPQQESLVDLKGGGSKFVIVAGQPIELNDDACMLFTFNDLDQRKKMEVSLRHSEERFAKAFRLAPVPMLVCSQPGWHVLDANDAFVALTGCDLGGIRGRTVVEAGFWKGMKVVSEIEGLLAAHHAVRNHEIPLRTCEGMVIDCLLSAEPVTIRDEPCVLCVLPDVTEYKRTEEELITAIEAVMQDASWFSRTVMEKLAQIRHPDDGRQAELAALTAREREVLELICKGMGNAEIAATLGLSANTVRNHVATLYDKIGVNRRSAAVVWGRERGLAGY